MIFSHHGYEGNEEKKGYKKSKFVTNLGWIFIGFFGYSTTVTLLQSIVFLIKPPIELLKGIFTCINVMDYIPPAFIYVLKNLRLFTMMSFILSIITLIASFAFLKRRNWARIFFAIFMIGTIVFSFTGIFHHDVFMLDIPVDENMGEIVYKMNKVIGVFLITMVIIIFVLHGWLAYKLLSKNVREEFQ